MSSWGPGITLTRGRVLSVSAGLAMVMEIAGLNTLLPEPSNARKRSVYVPLVTPVVLQL